MGLGGLIAAQSMQVQPAGRLVTALREKVWEAGLAGAGLGLLDTAAGDD